jgi:hypothetical protein
VVEVRQWGSRDDVPRGAQQGSTVNAVQSGGNLIFFAHGAPQKRWLERTAREMFRVARVQRLYFSQRVGCFSKDEQRMERWSWRWRW